MILGGAFHIYLGYGVFQFVVLPIFFPFHTLVGTIMVILGVLFLSVSLAVWLQKSWTIKTIYGICIASCAALIIFGYYLMIAFVGLICWAAVDYIKTSQVAELSDWDDN
jgi:apolipoprotein N-acyltransferase